jgi:hypothetical protein
MTAANDKSYTGISPKTGKPYVKRIDGRCNAKTTKGTLCKLYPSTGKTRCRLHGGASTGPKSLEGKIASKIALIKTAIRMPEEAAAMIREPGFQPDAEFGKQFCLNKYESDFCDFFYKVVEEKLTITDRTQLFFAGQMAIMILRGITTSKNSGKAWDFSRMLDSLNRTLRELDLTRNAKSSNKREAPKVDIMVMIQNYQSKIESEVTKPNEIIIEQKVK